GIRNGAHANGHGPNGNGHVTLSENGHLPYTYGLSPNGHGSANGHVDPGVSDGSANGKHDDDWLFKLGFIGNGFLRKGGDLLLKVHQERFADLAHLTLVTHDPPKGLSGLRNV